jgi:hypothetical protein
MTATPDLRKLAWKSEWGFQTVMHGSCYCIRETAGSIVAGAIFGVVLGAGSAVFGVWMIMTQPLATLAEKGFAGLMFVLAAVFLGLMWVSLRRGRWMLVYDRGQAGVPGEIRSRGKRIPASRVRFLSTRFCGGKMPQYSVTAELDDGSYEWLGPMRIQSWADHYAQTAAAWMNLPFRRVG